MIGFDENSPMNGFHVDWETIGVVLGDTNAVDLPEIRIHTVKEAEEFIKNYGFDYEVESERQDIIALKQDAVHFIEKQLLQDPDDPTRRLRMSEVVSNETDVRKLLVQASTEHGEVADWSCSVLRVMHTLTHISNDLSSNFFPAIQKQILDKVLGFTYTDSAGDVYLGEDEDGIRLYMLDIKTQKSYDSLVLKLLHKEDNTSADIFDRMGFRFVVFSKLEALDTLRYLKKNIFAFPNVRNNRSRNTLIDIGRFHYQLDSMLPSFRNEGLSEWQILQKVSKIAESEDCSPHISSEKKSEYNLYSSTKYTSIQITTRQLIRIKGPALSPMINPKKLDKDGMMDYKFFFPYEIQILDKDSYIESRKGRASHSEYKRSQLRAARERVFPWLNR